MFLLDDHEIVRAGFRELLALEAEDIRVVGEASTAAGAVMMCPPMHPDVAILDVRLQDGDGVDVCRILRERCPETACLIFTSADPGDDLLYKAIVAGAKGWILKHASMVEVIDAIRICARGGTALDSRSQALMIERLRRPGQPQLSPLHVLTIQEQRILRLIGNGLSNREIGREISLAENTVGNNISRIYVKLGVQSRTQAAAWARRAAEVLPK